MTHINFINDSNIDILLVDNDTKRLFLIQNLLNQNNISCLMASSGAQALSFIKKYTFKLIIIDSTLNAINSLELAKQFKKSDFTWDTPITFHTDNIQETQALLNKYKLATTELISKSLSSNEMMSKIKELLKESNELISVKRRVKSYKKFLRDLSAV